MGVIPLTNGKSVLVDDEDLGRLLHYRWHFTKNAFQPIGYAYCWNPYPSAMLMHRMIMQPIPQGMIVDHIDHNTLDNQKHNLRIITYSQNSHNRLNVKGYHWEASRKKWKAMIMISYRAVYLGRYDTEDEARAAYLTAKEQIFGSEG